MGSYGAAAEGQSDTFGGVAMYSPSSNEQGVAVTGRLNGAGAVGSTLAGVPVAPNLGVVTNIEQIVQGVGIGVLGVVSIFGTDGALTPVGLSMIADGVLQVANGVGGLTATQRGGGSLLAPSTGLTTAEQAQLTDAATGTWYDGSTVGAAVWDYDYSGT